MIETELLYLEKKRMALYINEDVFVFSMWSYLVTAGCDVSQFKWPP